MSPRKKKEQIGLAEEAKRMLDKGRDLARLHQFEEALKCYLFAYDNRHAVSGWGGVGNSYIPGEIAELGEVHPPARQALIDRRDALEIHILNETYAFDKEMSWISLNRYLKHEDHALEFMHRLESEGKLDADFRRHIIEDQFERFMKERKYGVLAEYLNEMIMMFNFMSTNCDEPSDDAPPVNKYFPNSHFRAMNRLYTRNKAAQLLELALAEENMKAVEKILERVFRACPGRKTIVKLIYAASRSGNKEFALNFIDASEEFLSEQMRERLKRRIENNNE